MIKIDNIKSNGKIKTADPIIKEVDVNILEYLLVCPLNDILSDEKLVNLILDTSYYRDAIMEGSNLLTLEFTYNDKKYKFTKTYNVSVLSLFDKTNKHRPILLNTIIIDSSQ